MTSFNEHNDTSDNNNTNEYRDNKWNVPFYFGGTSLLIIVVVTMDFMQQVQAYAMSHQYESLLKKSNLKGGAIPTR